MKKVCVFLIAMLLAIAGFSQTVISTFPWNDGFESGLTNWTQSYVSGTNSWAQSTSASGNSTISPNEGTHMATYSHNDYDDQTKLVSPVFDLSGITNPVLSFYYQNNSWTGDVNYLTVYYRTDTSSTGTWTQLATYTSATEAWTHVEMPLNSTSTTYQLAFEGYDNYGYPVCLDNVSITAVSCAVPTSLAASNFTTTSFDLSWTDATSSAWTIQYMSSDSTNWANSDSITGVATNPYSFTGLTANTGYKVRVKAVCSATDESQWTDPITVHTPCETISSFPYVENFENGISCWQSAYSGTYAWNVVTTGDLPSCSPLNGTHMLKYQSYSAQTGNWATLVSAPMSFTAAMRVSYWFYKYGSNSDRIALLVNSNPDTVGATLIGTETLAGSGWTKINYYLPESVTGTQYIILKAISNYGYNMYIDSLTIEEAPACTPPTALTVSNVTTTSVDLSWTNGHTTDNSWYVYYKTSAATSWDSVAATTNPFTISGLNSSTVYNFKVATNCSEGISEYTTPVTTNTACDIISVLPYTETFDNWGTGTSAYPVCWSRIMSGGSLYIYPYTYHSGVGSLYIYGLTPIAITPQIDTTTYPLNTLRVKFYDYSYNTGYGVVVGAMTSPTDTASFTPIDTVYVTSTSTWQQFEVPFSSYTGAGSCIAFKIVASSSYSSTYLDDIEISAIPSCAKPTALASSNATQTSVDISWTPGHETDASWYVYYKQATDTVWDSVAAATNPFTLSGLNASTAYTVRMATECSDGISEYSDAITAVTACGIISTFPWTEGFETAWQASTDSNFIAAPVCWTNIDKGTTTAKNWRRSTSNAHSGTAAAAMYSDYSDGNNDWLITPQLALTGNQRLRFWTRCQSTSEPDELTVWISGEDDSIDVSSMGASDSLAGYTQLFSQAINYTSYQRSEINLSAYTGNRRIAFVRRNAPTDGWNLYLDDVEVSDVPPCGMPTALTASNPTQTSMDLSWTVAHETDASWYIFYKPVSDTVYDSVLVSTNPYTLTGLQASTAYNLFVATECSGALSEIQDTISAYTACGAISTLPYSEGFEAYGTGATAYPHCWTKLGGSSNNMYIYTTNHYGEGTHSLFFNVNGGYEIATLPQIDTSVIDINTLALQFVYASLNTINPIQIGVMTDPADASTFTQVATVSPFASNYWDPKEVRLSSYTGNGTYIAFKVVYPSSATSEIDGVLDGIVLTTASDCPQTYSLAASEKTNSSIKVSWENANSNGNGWQLQYWPAADTTATPTNVALAAGTNSPYTITGLTAGTIYAIAVRQVCTAGAAWSDTITAKTMTVAPTTLPYYSDFSDSTERNNWYLSNSTCTNKWCWGTASAIDSGNYTLYISNNNGVANAYTTSITGNEVVTATRQFISTGAGAYTLSFKERVAGEGSYDYLKVFVGTSLHEGVVADYSSVPSWSSTSYNGDGALKLGDSYWKSNGSAMTTTHTFLLPAMGDSGSVRNITFMWRQDGSTGTQPPVSIDSILIEPVLCAPPTFAVDNMTTTTAQVTWTGSTGDNAWYIYYKPSTATAYDSIAVTASPYTLTNLTPSTVYSIYMANNCSGGIGVPSVAQSFATECAGITTLPYSESFDAYGTGTGHYPLCWNKLSPTTSSSASPYPYISNTNTSAPGALYFYCYSTYPTEVAILPELDSTISIDSLLISYKIASYSSNFTLSLGIMTDPNDITTFDTIATMAPAATSGWTLCEVPTNTYTGTGRYLAFMFKSTSYISGYLDDVTVDYIPSCFHPNAAVATNITTTGATLSWSGTAGSYVVSCVSPTDTVTVATTDTTTVITGLQPSTGYTVYVRGVCSVGDTSLAAPLSTFSTHQVPGTIPYYCDFNASGNNGWTFENSTATNKWYVGTPTGFTDGKMFISSDNGTTNNYNNSSTSVTLAEKVLQFPADTTILSFKLQVGGEGSWDFLKVFLVGEDDSTLVAGTSLGAYGGPTYATYSTNVVVKNGSNYYLNNPNSPTTVTTYTAVIPPMSTADTTMKLVFMWRNDGSSGTMPGATIDSVVVTTTNACAAPTGLAATTTNSAAVVSWTTGGEESAWQVKLDNDTVFTDVYAPTYTFTGLSQGSTHTAYVRSNCGTGYSAWSSIQFTTLSGQFAPEVTTNSATGVTQTAVTLSGVYVQGTDTVSAVGFEYKKTADATWTDIVAANTIPVPTAFTTNVTTLAANTAYQVRAYAVTATEGKTYGDTVTFTTLANVLPSVTTGAVTNLTQTTATFNGTTAIGTESIIARGFEYKKTADANWIDVTATGTATISANVTGLTVGTGYVVRAYAQTQTDGKTYGTEVAFTTTSSLNDVSTDAVEITMYPNPTESTTKLTVSGVSGQVQIVMSDVQGRIIKTINAKAENGMVQQEMNVSPLAKGVYYIRVITDKLNRTQKLIVK